MTSRTNAEWLTALKSDNQAQSAALSELRAYLLRAARYALSRKRSTLRDSAPTDIDQLAEDCAQEALSALLGRLDEFRGESLFTTWAYKFAVNAALVAARRERWGRVPLDGLLDTTHLLERIGSFTPPSSNPQRRTLQAEIISAIRQGIERRLTERQRQAITATVFEEVPLDELARHWGSNRNALYKLLHDARRKLKAHLVEHGFDVREVLDVFSDER